MSANGKSSLVEEVRAVQAALPKDLASAPFFVATQTGVPDDVHRALEGGLITSVRSLGDVLDQLERALDSGAEGVRLNAPNVKVAWTKAPDSTTST